MEKGWNTLHFQKIWNENHPVAWHERSRRSKPKTPWHRLRSFRYAKSPFNILFKEKKLKNRKIVYVLVPVALAVAIFAVYYADVQTVSRTEIAFPLEVTEVRHSFDWLNVTFLATEDLAEPIVGFEVYYEGQKVGEENYTVIELRANDNITINLELSNDLPSGETIEIKLLLGSKYYQKFQITIP